MMWKQLNETFMMISNWSLWFVLNYFSALRVNPWDRLQTSESDVRRRQILTPKVDPRTVRVKIFLMAVDP